MRPDLSIQHAAISFNQLLRWNSMITSRARHWGSLLLSGKRRKQLAGRCSCILIFGYGLELWYNQWDFLHGAKLAAGMPLLPEPLSL